MANDNLPAGAPAPRLCHLVKWSSSDEFGFNLHAEKTKLGQYIGKVDEDSPAFYAGLIEGDRIVEVNDVNISNENHKQVVERIKSIPNETRLLVVDEDADRWYKERKLVIKGTQSNVIYKRTPPERPSNHRAIGASDESSSKEINGIASSKKSSPKRDSKSSELSTASSEGAPAPRLCHIIKWPDFEDYGFNLHANKNGGGQYVGKVDEGSPADLAGLREGDRIIEVNGENVVGESHRQLVDRIKVAPGETILLVLDEEGERWYRERGIVPRSTQPNVIRGKTPLPRPTANALPPASHGVNGTSTLAKGGELPPDAPAPRLCHLFKWPDFDGYGFTLHAEKNKQGQHIGKVDPDSPAEYAGLMEGDRIVEVNGVNVTNDGHRQLVERIKAMPGETRLLVLDAEGERWYRERHIVPSSSQPNVIVMRTPVPRPTSTVAATNHLNGAVVDPAAARALHEEVSRKLEEVRFEEAHDSRSSTPQSVAQTGSVHDSPRSDHSVPSATATKPQASPPASGQTSAELNLNMTASEMRQLLASRKKYDPKKVQMDLREKYNLIQQM